MQYKIFWCKVNKYYTDIWLNSDYLEGKQGIFIASCVVTDKAKKKWVKFVIDSIKKLEQNEKIYLSWCGSLDKWKVLTTFYEVYKELAPYKDKIEVLPEEPELVKSKKSPLIPLDKGDGSSDSESRWISKSIYTKKFILIQSGCDSFCTFCLTVQKRWAHFFREKEAILNDIIDYEKAWGKEIVLTGVNLWAWGLKSTNDLSWSRLSELIESILNETKIRRIRISSLWPEFVDDKLLKLFENKRIYPHFHFSLQSGSDEILKSMHRHYDSKYIKDMLEKTRNIKREDWVSVSIWADLIIGFPGETEEDFQDTYNLVSDYKITKLHAFTFSPHKYGENVPAWSYKNQVDEKTKKESYDRISKLAENIRNEFINSQKGKTFEVLIESVKNGKFKGWTENYIEVTSDNFEVISGVIKRNEIVVGKLK